MDMGLNGRGAVSGQVGLVQEDLLREKENSFSIKIRQNYSLLHKASTSSVRPGIEASKIIDSLLVAKRGIKGCKEQKGRKYKIDACTNSMTLLYMYVDHFSIELMLPSYIHILTVLNPVS